MILYKSERSFLRGNLSNFERAEALQHGRTFTSRQMQTLLYPPAEAIAQPAFPFITSVGSQYRTVLLSEASLILLGVWSRTRTSTSSASRRQSDFECFYLIIPFFPSSAVAVHKEVATLTICGVHARSYWGLRNKAERRRKLGENP